MKKFCAVIRPTVDALGISLLVAISAPTVFALIGWRLALPIQDSTALYALGMSLQGGALVWFTLRMVRQMTRPGGVGEKHFGWPAKGCLRIRRHTLWLMYVWLPVVATVLFWGAFGTDAWPQILGRLFFIVALFLTGIYTVAMLRAARGGISLLLELDAHPAWRRGSVFLIVLLELFFLALAVAAIQGYFFTAVRLGENAFRTVSAGFLIYVLFCFGRRWILVTKRRLNREQRKKRLQAASEQTSVDESLVEQEAIYRIDEQTRKLLRTVCIVSLFLLTGFIWIQELPALKALNGIEVWSTTATVTEMVPNEDGTLEEVTETRQVPITLLGLGSALLIASIGFVMIKNVPGLLEIAILRFTAIGSGERYAITTLSTYVLVVAITVWTVSALGVGWSQVQWLVAALSLGLGFGLQEIFANFVSGIIVLFERPVRVGDIITVSGQSGMVTKIQIRATTIRDFDRKELIIPNKELVTGQLLNWTLSDAMLRIVVPVGIAYGSDTDKAEELIWEILNKHEWVAKDPAPRVLFLQFGDNTLNYEVQAHCASIDNAMFLKHQLHKQIDQAFREASIEIAFPQRDLHIKEPIQIVYQGKEPQ